MCNPNVPHGLPEYASTGQDNAGSLGMAMSSESPMRDAWPSQQQMPSGFNGHPGLRTTLFQSTQGLGQDTSNASMYANPAQSVHTTLGASVFPNYDSAGPSINTNVYQTPQVVVPSQLSPHEDYPMDHCYDHQEVEDGFTQSFDSSGSGYSTWEHVEPQSPQEMYFGKTEDDFVEVKHEAWNPSRVPSRARFFETGPSQSRPRRRGSKRGRKSNAEGNCWYQADVHNMEIRCAGAKFSRYQAADGSFQYRTEERKETKPHKCTHEDEDGKRCTSSFERSEHLKRHMSKHSKERRYPCPLQDCNKRISRPDNAADHFRTHLRQPTKGKRNKHCSFEDLRKAIRAQYEPKMADKLLGNLDKWFANEQERLEIAERQKALESIY